MPELIILGSSSTFPFPRTVTNQMGDYSDIENYQKKFPLHDDIICKLADKGGKEKRTRSSIALKISDKTIVIDAGPDFVYQCKKYGVRPDTVFITHDHFDANGGIKYLGGTDLRSESLGNVNPGKGINFFGIQIIPFRVIHGRDVNTCGYKIDTGKTKFAYMSDLGSTAGIKRWIIDCDFILMDGSNLEQNLPTHLSIVSQLNVYKKWGIKKVWVTHIGHKTLPHEELRKYCQSVYANTDVVFDGLKMNVI